MKNFNKKTIIFLCLITSLAIILFIKWREEKPGILPSLSDRQTHKIIFDPNNLPSEEPVYSNYTPPPPPKNGPSPREQVETAKKWIEEDKKKSLLEGIVVQKDTSEPIAKAIVRLNGSLINITDESGKFAYSILPGNYNIYAIYSYDSNIRSNHENLSVLANQKYFVKLEMPSYGKIDGIVVSEEGTHVCDVKTSLFNPFFGKSFIELDSNEDGKFSFNYLNPINELEPALGVITYRITASHNDYLYYEDFIPAYAGKTSTIKIILTKRPLPMIVKGKITDNEGNPIQDITVRHKYAEPGEYTLAQQAKGQLQYSKDAKIRGQQDISSFTSTSIDVTSETGEYIKKIMMIDYNKLYLIVKPQQKYAAYETELIVMSGKTYELNIILPEGQHITGVVLDKNDKPIEHIMVYVIPSPSGDFESEKYADWYKVETDSNGHFDAGNLTPGLLYAVSVNFSGEDVELKNISAPALDLIVRTPFAQD